jgi:hypothetical protein
MSGMGNYGFYNNDAETYTMDISSISCNLYTYTRNDTYDDIFSDIRQQ